MHGHIIISFSSVDFRSSPCRGVAISQEFPLTAKSLQDVFTSAVLIAHGGGLRKWHDTRALTWSWRGFWYSLAQVNWWISMKIDDEYWYRLIQIRQIQLQNDLKCICRSAFSSPRGWSGWIQGLHLSSKAVGGLNASSPPLESPE